VLHAISDYEAAVLEGLASKKLEIDLPLHLVKERNPRAQQDGMNVQDDFINQIGFKQALRQLSAAKEANARRASLRRSCGRSESHRPSS
jgi:hypothetical protein